MNASVAVPTPGQDDILKLGLTKLCPCTNKAPTDGHSGYSGRDCRNLGKIKANDLCGQVCGALKRSRPPTDNLSGNHKRALKDL